MPAARPQPPDGRPVLVTGASSGIGRAVVTDLVATGFTVLGTVRTTADGAALEEIAPTRVNAIVLDLEHPASVRRAAVAIDTALAGRPLFATVLNAGIALPAPIALVPMGEFRQHFEVNVFGHVLLLQLTLPLMRADPAHPGPAHVVIVSSVSGRLADPFLGAYAASKHALEAVASSLRREVDGGELRVSIIEPAAVRTPIWDKGAGVDLSPFAGTAYSAKLERLRSALLEEAVGGCDAERVATAVRRCLTSPRHRRRRFVSAPRHVGYRLLPLLPMRAYDVLCARILGSGAAPAGAEVATRPEVLDRR